MTVASTPTAPAARSGYTAPSGDLAVSGSEPYPWPFDGRVAASRTALLLVAVQRGLVVRCPQAEAALAVIASLSSAARGWGATVIHTRHARSPAQRRPGVLSASGEGPWELLHDPVGDIVVDAFGLDGFAGSPLAERLAGAGIDHLLVCGLGLEGPVHSTLRSANDRGLECLLVADACAPADPSLTAAALGSIEMSGGIFGAVATTSDVLAALRSKEGS
jgi:nicotinamidase-related amidase